MVEAARSIAAEPYTQRFEHIGEGLWSLSVLEMEIHYRLSSTYKDHIQGQVHDIPKESPSGAADHMLDRDLQSSVMETALAVDLPR